MTTKQHSLSHKSDTEQKYHAFLAPFNASFFQNQEGGWEFQGGKNDMVDFQLQMPPGEFDRRIRYI